MGLKCLLYGVKCLCLVREALAVVERGAEAGPRKRASGRGSVGPVSIEMGSFPA